MLAETTRPLRRGLFSMAGVANPGADIDAVIAPLRVGLGPRRIRCADDVLLVPFDGLVDRHGATLPDGMMHRNPDRIVVQGLPRVTPVAPAAVLDREALFLGRFSTHFGHFLLEAMARWWATSQVPREMPLLWLCQPGFAPEVGHAWIARFGIAPERVMMVTEPLRVRRLLLPDVTFEIRNQVHEDAALPFHELGDLLAGTPPLTGQPLYLSRAGLASSKRGYLGEVQFEDYLRQEGVRVIRPETLPMPEQIRLVRQSPVIVGSWGSALHLVLFTRHRPSVHMFTGASFHPNYALQSEALDTPLNAINGLPRADRKPVIRVGNRHAYDFAAVAAHLHAAGILGNPALAAMPLPTGLEPG